ncbi:MAG: hypothetical protein BWX71_01111 [Deltaproteobacteria bacterium ADurb.Bin072]|nr:MAG: hypothetical protein BWX71_01111 [Deltaproteobacteria bacterium ADurb.Bin072]
MPAIRLGEEHNLHRSVEVLQDTPGHGLALFGPGHGYTGEDPGQHDGRRCFPQAQGCRSGIPVHEIGILVQRVSRQVEPDPVLFHLEALRLGPVRYVGKHEGLSDVFRGELLQAEQGTLGIVPAACRPLCLVEEGFQHLEHGPAVRMDPVKGAGLDESLHDAAVHPGQGDPVQERGDVREGAVPLTFFEHRIHRVLSQVLDGPQAEADAVVRDHELETALVDVRAEDRNAFLPALCDMLGDFIRVVHVERQVRSHELPEVVGLEVCGLIGDQCIRRGMGLVEPIIGELLHEVEDLPGLVPVHAALHGPRHEDLPLGGHLLADLLAHGAPEKVRLAQRVARHLLGDLHDLLLVDDDAVGLLQDLLQEGMGVINVLPAVSPVHIGWDEVHGSRPVQCHGSDDVLELLRLELPEHASHARAFELEHARCVAVADELVGEPVVEGYCRDVQVDSLGPQDVNGLCDDGERLEAQHIELDKAHALDALHVVLADEHALLVDIHRDMGGQGVFVRYDDPAGMDRGMPAQAFQGPGDLDEPAHHRIALHELLQPRFGLDGLLESDVEVVRNELGNPVHIGIAHAEHPADVPDDGLGLHIAEGCDLAHVLGTVTVLHVLDDLIPAVLAEIHIDIRHAPAFWVEEPFEQQVPPDGVDVGDPQAVGSERTRCAAPAGANRDTVVLGILDVVGNDEEIARETHGLDDLELFGEPSGVVLRDGFSNPRLESGPGLLFDDLFQAPVFPCGIDGEAVSVLGDVDVAQ